MPDDPFAAYLDALDILSNWRSAHSFPLNTFQMGLRTRARAIYAHALVAQRLKRVPSIIAKLERYPSMGLSRMQDIGGCRAVLDTVPQVRRLTESYLKSSIKHKLVTERDYISMPKDSGYRSVHLVYRYFSDKAPAHNALQIEVQLRSRLQHSWATAVETVGAFLEEALKSSEGSVQWLRFFALASSAFALTERTPIVPGTPDNPGELIAELREYTDQLRVFDILRAYGAALKFTETKVDPDARYYLLTLSLDEKRLALRTYRLHELDKATKDYLEIEKEEALRPGRQAVLVAADSLSALRKAYPSYFLDTQVFLEQLRRVLS
jgi:hypothetical protein